MLTIGQLARRFALSRSALLYYDSIGLLRPSARSHAGYRLYSEADVERMERIDLYRRAGLPLEEIRRVLASEGDVLVAALEKRLRALNREIHALRDQQRQIVQLLKGRDALQTTRHLDKDRWVAILRATGLDEADMRRWHTEFERSSPEAHQDFLESLGLDSREIERIREGSRAGGGLRSGFGAQG